LTLDDYQRNAAVYAIFPPEIGLAYPALGLNGEAGELAEHAKKMIRDDQGVLTDDRREKIKKELGDVLWYLAACATEANLKLSDIGVTNLLKLESRQQRGVLSGSGDDR
jgi:NTP pyrophosphatase (non-canonical NTP hydrolase)